jgi:hypothetical protein
LVVGPLEYLTIFAAEGLPIHELAHVGLEHPLEGSVQVPVTSNGILVADKDEISKFL